MRPHHHEQTPRAITSIIHLQPPILIDPRPPEDVYGGVIVVDEAAGCLSAWGHLGVEGDAVVLVEFGARAEGLAFA